MIPSDYKPKTVEDFIGSARQAAGMLLKQYEKANGSALKMLLLGRPGIGKSAVIDWFINEIGAAKWNVEKFNGTAFKIDQIARIRQSFHYLPLTNDYSVIQIEEVDKVPWAAQVGLLTLLDELPKRWLFVATSNCQANHLEARFHTRFQTLEIKAPSYDEIYNLIMKHWGDIPKEKARWIAEMSGGNVRQALLDIQTLQAEMSLG